MKANNNIKHTRKALNALIKSHKHWEIMIEWVKKQDKLEYIDEYKMKNEINQNWYARSCALCKLDNNSSDDCSNCPFTFYKNNCLETNSLWHKVEYSYTWEEWLINAKKMLKKINEIIKIYEENIKG